MILFFIAICFVLYFVVQRFYFKDNSPEYRKVCRPIVVWSLIAFGICGVTFFEGLSVSLGFTSPYTKWYDFGSNFGDVGLSIAGGLAQMDMESRMASNPALNDYLEMGLNLCMFGFVFGVWAFVVDLLTLKGIKGIIRKSFSFLSVLYFIAGICSGICVGLFMSLGSVLNSLSNHEEATEMTIAGVIWGCIAALGVSIYYFVSYRKTLHNVLKAKPFEAVFNFNKPKTSFGSSIASAISQTVNNNPDADKPTKSCPFCGETILAVAVKCKHCGEWLPKEESPKMVECKICGEMVEEGTEICPYCHEKIDGSSVQDHTPHSKMITCPVCAEQIPYNVKVCPICNEKIK